MAVTAILVQLIKVGDEVETIQTASVMTIIMIIMYSILMIINVACNIFKITTILIIITIKLKFTGK